MSIKLFIFNTSYSDKKWHQQKHVIFSSNKVSSSIMVIDQRFDSLSFTFSIAQTLWQTRFTNLFTFAWNTLRSFTFTGVNKLFDIEYWVFTQPLWDKYTIFIARTSQHWIWHCDILKALGPFESSSMGSS